MSPKTVWEFKCLNCGYRLAEVMVNQARFDYGCPKCGCSFEQFTYRKRRMGKMEAEMTYLLEEKTRKLENAEMLIERLKREVKELDFSVALHDRAAKKARAIWEEAHPDKAPEWPCREDLMAGLTDRVERAEAVKESLKASLMEISGFSAYWKCFRGNEGAWENVWNIAIDVLIREYFTKKALSEKALKSVEITETNFKPWKFGTMELIDGERQFVERPLDYETHGYGNAPCIYDSDGNELVGCDEYYYAFSGPEIIKMILGIPDMMNQIQWLLKSHNETLEALEGAKWLIDCYVSKPERYEEYQDVVKAIRKARGEE